MYSTTESTGKCYSNDNNHLLQQHIYDNNNIYNNNSSVVAFFSSDEEGAVQFLIPTNDFPENTTSINLKVNILQLIIILRINLNVVYLCKCII